MTEKKSFKDIGAEYAQQQANIAAAKSIEYTAAREREEKAARRQTAVVDALVKFDEVAKKVIEDAVGDLEEFKVPVSPVTVISVLEGVNFEAYNIEHPKGAYRWRVMFRVHGVVEIGFASGLEAGNSHVVFAASRAGSSGKATWGKSFNPVDDAVDVISLNNAIHDLVRPHLIK